jgi:hypothetical protein
MHFDTYFKREGYEFYEMARGFMQCIYVSYKHNCIHAKSPIKLYPSKKKNSLSILQVAYNRAVNIRMYSLHPKLTLLQNVQTGPGVHSTSHPLGTGGSFTGGKTAGA